MKNIKTPIAIALITTSATICSSPAATSLMVNLRLPDSTNANAGGDVTDSYLTLSPAHATGVISSEQTNWNNLTDPSASSSLFYSNGTAASGVTISFGSESSGPAATIDYNTTGTINSTALRGSGGGTSATSLVAGENSIYGFGDNSSNTAASRAGWFGNSGGINDAIGIRIDGLAAGDYQIYVMGRNTNTVIQTSMNMFLGTGMLNTSFDYSSLTPTLENNFEVPNFDSAGHNEFREGDNYVVINFSLDDDESLFLASDGTDPNGEDRGFLNMVQVVAIPEPSVSLLTLIPAFFLLRRRR
jgi:hypothetical protein